MSLLSFQPKLSLLQFSVRNVHYKCNIPLFRSPTHIPSFFKSSNVILPISYLPQTSQETFRADLSLLKEFKHQKTWDRILSSASLIEHLMTFNKILHHPCLPIKLRYYLPTLLSTHSNFLFTRGGSPVANLINNLQS